MTSVRESGFILSETLIASVIASLAIVLFLSAGSLSLQKLDRAKTRLTQAQLADSLLQTSRSEVQAAPWSRSGEKEGLIWEINTVPSSDSASQTFPLQTLAIDVSAPGKPPYRLYAEAMTTGR